MIFILKRNLFKMFSERVVYDIIKMLLVYSNCAFFSIFVDVEKLIGIKDN